MTGKRFDGYHDDHEIPVKKGDVVTIRKGVTIRTMRSKPEDRTRVAGRTYRVVVDHILNGMNRPPDDPRHNKTYPVHNPAVRWTGAGGYWYEVDINDIPEAQPKGSFLDDWTAVIATMGRR